MGCVPPERKASSTAASIAVKRHPSLKQLDSKSKTSSNSVENNNLKLPIKANSPTHRSSKQLPGTSSPKSKNQLSSSKQTYVYSHNSNSPTRKSEKEVVRVLPPNYKEKNDPKTDDLSKLTSVHSLDIHSHIKKPQNVKNIPHNIQRKEHGKQQGREEEINITFNNNNFLTSNSNGRNTGLGMGKRWREETLREELRVMNEEHFRKIHIDSMNFN